MCWTAEVAGGGATADVLAGVLGALRQVRDEHPVAALTNTQPATTATRIGRVVTNDMRSSSRGPAKSESDRSRCSKGQAGAITGWHGAY